MHHGAFNGRAVERHETWVIVITHQGRKALLGSDKARRISLIAQGPHRQFIREH